MKIGLFDSGVGGLTVLKSFLKYHPNNEYYYYGDTLNVPYGDKTKEELRKCVNNILEYLKEKKVEMIIIACGTVSANLYEELKEELDIPIYSVISELPKYIEEKNYKNILVMATNATINTHVFKNRLKNNVIEVACPKLVPAIEKNDMNAIDSILDEYLENVQSIDSIVLGCTHYPIIKDKIRKKVGEQVDIIDMGEILARNIQIKDSTKNIELFFSKKTKELDNNVKMIIKNM
jgi:glutamate racemase